MQYIIDTNIFLEAFVRSGSRRSQSCAKLIGLIDSGKLEVVVPGLVIAEVGWTLLSFYKVPKAQVLEILEIFISSKGITILDDYLYTKAFKLYKTYSVKYIDACIASMEIWGDNDCVVVSYDKDFDKIGASRSEPEKILHSVI